jgi:hypothetical protein
MKYVTSSGDVVNTGGMELEQETDGSYVLAPAVGSQIGMHEQGEPIGPDEDEELLAALAEAYPLPEES